MRNLNCPEYDPVRRRAEWGKPPWLDADRRSLAHLGLARAKISRGDSGIERDSAAVSFNHWVRDLASGGTGGERAEQGDS